MRPGLVLQAAAASEISRYFLPPVLPTNLLRPAMLRLAPLPNGIALQFGHARDVARTVLLVLRERAGGAFNVATSRWPIAEAGSRNVPRSNCSRSSCRRYGTAGAPPAGS